jgi:hypothetical protein
MNNTPIRPGLRKMPIREIRQISEALSTSADRRSENAPLSITLAASQP